MVMAWSGGELGKSMASNRKTAKTNLGPVDIGNPPSFDCKCSLKHVPAIQTLGRIYTPRPRNSRAFPGKNMGGQPKPLVRPSNSHKYLSFSYLNHPWMQVTAPVHYFSALGKIVAGAEPILSKMPFSKIRMRAE